MSYLRPAIEQLQAYVPGEQPQAPGLVKLNTNENPYPPSPKVVEALQAAVGERLRLYPDPVASTLRARLGERYGFAAEQVIVGNGCDDILNLCVRAFCDAGDKLAYFSPSYSLYPVLADLQGARRVELPLDDQFQIAAHPGLLRQLDGVKLVFVTQPNAPSGVWLQRVELQRVIEETRGVVVIDEAYADFAADHCLDFARDYPNVLVARSFSKSFSLAGLRLGWAAGPSALVDGLRKVKDSYNVGRLAQVAGEAALADQPYFEETVGRVKTTRARLAGELRELGFEVCPSQANFLFVRPPAPLTAEAWFQKLRDHQILIRWWNADRIRDHARVSIGTDEEINQLLNVTRKWIA